MGFPDRPKRPYRTLDEFRQSRFSYHSRTQELKRDGTFWPCLVCEGKGWNHRDEDYDIIEGFKLAPTYKCQACAGTGRGTKEEVQAIYREVIAKFRAALAAWKVQDRLRKSGLRKLTQAERHALGL